MKIAVDIPDDGTCSGCLFLTSYDCWSDGPASSNIYQCRRFGFEELRLTGLYGGDVIPSKRCENKPKEKKETKK